MIIRFIFFIPILEIYFGNECLKFYYNFFLKRTMYADNFIKRRFIFSSRRQTTLCGIVEKDGKSLLLKLNSKLRTQIRQFSKLKKVNSDIYISLENNVSEKFMLFILKKYRGQRPNIEKLKILAKQKMLYIISVKYNNKYQASMIWLKNLNKCRLIYNVLDHKELRVNKIRNCNKYLMYKSILDLSLEEVKEIDLGGISGKNNEIDQFKKAFAQKEKYTYNYIYI